MEFLLNLNDNSLSADRKAADNKVFAIVGVQCFVDNYVQGGSSVFRTKFSAKTPRHLKSFKL